MRPPRHLLVAHTAHRTCDAARGVTVHPSPTIESVVAWRSPLDGKVQAEGLVADADDKCGNGAAWRVEVLSESGTSRLAAGVFDNGGEERYMIAAIDVRIGVSSWWRGWKPRALL